MELEVILVLEMTALVASENGGVVRPLWVEDRLKETYKGDAPNRYRVRKCFAAFRESDLVQLRGNYYMWNMDNVTVAFLIDAGLSAEGAA